MSVSNSLRRCAVLCAAAIAAFDAFSAGAETRVTFPDNPRFAVQRLEEQFGLGVVTATAMAQDSQGFLWIGTQTGLYRYDGARAVKMTAVEEATGHYIMDLLIAPDGTPWFAGNRGIAWYKDGQFHKLDMPSSAKLPINGNQVFAVDSKGQIFVLLFGVGVLRMNPLHPGGDRIFGPGDGITESAAGIIRGSDDSVWFTFGSHLAHIAAESDTVVVDPAMELPHDRVVALLFDGSQTMWLRTAMHLARVDTRTHKLISEPVAVGTAHEEEGKPTVDQRGNLLVPSSSGLYWQQNGSWRLLTNERGLSSNNIQFALEDREGTLWIAGSGTGLDRLPGVREWSAWTSAEGLPENSTWATLRDLQGRLWVSTGRGLAVWNAAQHRWNRVPALPGHEQMEVRQIQLAHDGFVWALTGTGALLRVNPQGFSTTAIPFYSGRSFQTLVAGPDGDIWATTRTRLVRFDTHKPGINPIDYAPPGPPAEDIQYIGFSSNGVLWATGTGTLSRFDGQGWRTFVAQDGLQGQNLTSLAVMSDDEVWVAYNDVLSVTHLRLDLRGKPLFDHRAWDVNIVGRDSQGRVWFNGTDGITVASRGGQTQHYSHADGLLWDDLSPWTGVREEADGSFLIATSRGLARYQPAGQNHTGVRLNVVLTSVSLGGIERNVADAPEVRPADGLFTVQFSPLVLGNPARVSCRYQLNGLEEQPSETPSREARYAGLSAGSYQFWVQCHNPDLGLASIPATFRFRVLPNFWQTWWFRALGIALSLGCFWGYAALRTQTLHRRKRELEHAVARRSAELLQKNRELEEISLTDPLTGTRNRRYFYETISTDVARALRSHLKTAEHAESARQELIFVLVDIDRFKSVNDELGHPAGDRLLQEVAKRIASVMRRSDDLVRWGGEEFLLVCRTTDRENAGYLCNRVLEAVRDTPFEISTGVQIHKTCSIGWAPFPWLREDVSLLSTDNVIELADKALYLAKREGRNRTYGMLPAEDILERQSGVCMEKLRDCPPDLVQFV